MCLLWKTLRFTQTWVESRASCRKKKIWENVQFKTKFVQNSWRVWVLTIPQPSITGCQKLVVLSGRLVVLLSFPLSITASLAGREYLWANVCGRGRMALSSECDAARAAVLVKWTCIRNKFGEWTSVQRVNRKQFKNVLGSLYVYRKISLAMWSIA